MTKAEGERLARLEEAVATITRDFASMATDVRAIRDAMLTGKGATRANARAGSWIKNVLLAIATLGAGYLGAAVHTKMH